MSHELNSFFPLVISVTTVVGSGFSPGCCQAITSTNATLISGGPHWINCEIWNKKTNSFCQGNVLETSICNERSCFFRPQLRNIIFIYALRFHRFVMSQTVVHPFHCNKGINMVQCNISYIIGFELTPPPPTTTTLPSWVSYGLSLVSIFIILLKILSTLDHALAACFSFQYYPECNFINTVSSWGAVYMWFMVTN